MESFNMTRNTQLQNRARVLSKNSPQLCVLQQCFSPVYFFYTNYVIMKNYDNVQSHVRTYTTLKENT